MVCTPAWSRPDGSAAPRALRNGLRPRQGRFGERGRAANGEARGKGRHDRDLEASGQGWRRQGRLRLRPRGLRMVGRRARYRDAGGRHVRGELDRVGTRSQRGGGGRALAGGGGPPPGGPAPPFFFLSPVPGGGPPS